MELNSTLLFARTFLKEPKMLGSVIPSSRFLIHRLLRHMDFDRARVVVEFGPGVGNITNALLRRMRPDSNLVAIETNADLAEHLNSSMDDRRLRTVVGSAERVQETLASLGLPGADYIISGIPFSTMPTTVRDTILRNSYDALVPGGEMIIYQFSGAVLHHLRKLFPNVEQEMEPLNVLPAKVFLAQKPAASVA
ncbi:MAG TPA: rRNA adenine N-6-methyltransferase family protein [Terriglobales bacterium]